MDTFANSEDPDDSSESTLFVKVKKSSDKRKQFFFNYNLTTLVMYNGYPKCIVSKQKEQSIGIQRIKQICPRMIQVFIEAHVECLGPLATK